MARECRQLRIHTPNLFVTADCAMHSLIYIVPLCDDDRLRIDPVLVHNRLGLNHLGRLHISLLHGAGSMPFEYPTSIFPNDDMILKASLITEIRVAHLICSPRAEAVR